MRLNHARFRGESTISGMTPQEEANAELGRRLAAAYASYVAGHTGVDRILKRTERAGEFWNDLADVLFKAMSGKAIDDLRFREVITKYIQ